MTRLRFHLFIPILLAGCLLAACQPVMPEDASTSPSTSSSTSSADSAATSPLQTAESTTYSDPFAYCEAVGDIDAPDERYTGPETPEAIAQKLRDDVFETPDTDLDVYMRGTYWRCMDGVVMACNAGANLPCQEKADTSTEPTQAMQDFCAENEDSDFIPAYITGRATIYAWQCDGTTAVAGDPFTEVDEQGFLSFVWHPLTP